MTDAEYYAKHRDEISKRAKAYYAAHPGIYKGYREKNREHNIAYSREYNKTHQEQQKASATARHKEFRLAALSAYSDGPPKCACCGENHLEFLAIDHTNSTGAEHRKNIGTGSDNMYRWLKKNGYPEGFRVLCHNCNQSLGHYGYCPHGKVS